MPYRFVSSYKYYLAILFMFLALVSTVALGSQFPEVTALHEAAADGNVSIIRKLIDDGVDVNAPDNRGRTALIFAASNNHYKIARILLDAGADVNHQTDYFGTALSTAAYQGNQDMVQMFLDYGADVDKGDALKSAASKGHHDIVRALLNAGSDVGNSEAIISASRHGHLGIVNTLLDAGTDVNTQDDYGYTALISASWEGHHEIVRVLIDAGADVNIRNEHGSTALTAASHRYHKIVRMLLDSGADVVSQSDALIGAAWNGHNEIVRMLLDAGADVNVQTKYEGTALMAAAQNDHREIVHTLLDAGANVHIIGRNGETAMTRTRDPRIIYPLFRAGDNIRNMNPRLLWDLMATIPTIISIILGIIAVIMNQNHLRKNGISRQHARKLRNDRRMYYYYLCNTFCFFLAYIGLVLFPRSQIPLYIMGMLLIAATITILFNESNKLAFPERYSSYPSILFLCGSLGLAMTAFLWFLLHWLDW